MYLQPQKLKRQKRKDPNLRPTELLREFRASLNYTVRCYLTKPKTDQAAVVWTFNPST